VARAIVVFAFLAVVYGALWAIVHLVVGEEVWQEISGTLTVSFVIAWPLILLIVPNPEGALWDALENDYPGRLPSIEGSPFAKGLIISSQVDDSSIGKTIATADALYLVSQGGLFRRTKVASLPWSKVTSIEVVQPADRVLQKSKAKHARDIYRQNLTAKIDLERKRNPLRLAIPWNDLFEKTIPSTVELKRDWSWID
jgi:hypothetical protein